MKKKQVVSGVQMTLYTDDHEVKFESGTTVIVSRKDIGMSSFLAVDPAKNVYSPEKIEFFLCVQREHLKPRMDRLYEATDWLPSPKARKLLKKMVADQDMHINDLVDKGQLRAAK